VRREILLREGSKDRLSRACRGETLVFARCPVGANSMFADVLNIL
jgi:hypothetical protein